MISSWLINLILLAFFGRTDVPARINPDVRLVVLNQAAPTLEIGAEKGAVLAVKERTFLYGKRDSEVQPIASITKLMTALVFLDNNPGWENIYQINETDKIEGGHLNLFPGEEVKIKDIFATSLIASDNGATIALVHATGLSEGEFVRQMNLRAKQLDLSKTSFFDPIGLSDNNISTAREVALLAKSALNRIEIAEATRSKEYHFVTEDGRTKDIESTDYLLFDEGLNSFTVLGGKTGYTERAGYCFVGRFKSADGRELIAAVLNSTGKNDRFKESKAVINWVFDNYQWR